MDRPRWVWERTDPRRSGSSGDIAKLFKHEQVKQPGVFALEPPSEKATLMAREVIQNSWDAAREHASTMQRDGPPPPFALTFRFKRLTGEAKRALVETLDLASHSTRVSSSDVDRTPLGLSARDCLDVISNPDEPLEVLEIVEENTTGMYGSWTPPESHMYFALVAIGYTEKAAGSGGSYGYGKAGLIAGSRIRSVLAYSCFAERASDPGVTRRLLGMTYWGQHKMEGSNFTGFARFGAQDGADPEHVRPFEGASADAVAKSLGLRVRSATDDDDEGPGTSFLLVDPTVRPQDLVTAIERSWWPAIIEENGNFTVAIVDHDGTRYDPRPKRHRDLRTFIDAWEIAQGRSEPRRDDLSSTLVLGAGRSTSQPKAEERLGRLALVSDLTDWSYADQVAGPDEGGIQHRSLVALTRGPRMVVEYYSAGQSPPYVRGVFIADDLVDDLLRRTEPKAHDAWRTEVGDGDVAGEAAATATAILKKIKYAVNNHRQRLKPPVPKAEDVVLPHFNAIMRRVLAGAGKGASPPISDVRPVAIRMEYAPEVVSGSQIRVGGTVEFNLSEHHAGDDATIEVAFSYRFVEDERVGEPAAMTIEPPEGGSFSQVREGVFVGQLRRDCGAKFAFETEPYDADWSGRLVATGAVISSESHEVPA